MEGDGSQPLAISHQRSAKPCDAHAPMIALNYDRKSKGASLWQHAPKGVALPDS
jgi:hypothetical protein